MPMLIKNNQILEDDWLVVAKSDTPQEVPDLPTGKLIVPVSMWLAHKQLFLDLENQIGVWLNSDESPTSIESDIAQFSVIALNFPVFTDGRAYSYARLLRERYAYKGELRAIGDVLQDQLFYMQRCGFNAFAIREDRPIDEAITAYSDFTDSYQAAVDQPVPLFRRR